MSTCNECKYSTTWTYQWDGSKSFFACGYNPPVEVELGDPAEWGSISMLPKVPKTHSCSKFKKES